MGSSSVCNSSVGMTLNIDSFGEEFMRSYVVVLLALFLLVAISGALSEASAYTAGINYSTWIRTGGQEWVAGMTAWDNYNSLEPGEYKYYRWYIKARFTNWNEIEYTFPAGSNYMELDELVTQSYFYARVVVEIRHSSGQVRASFSSPQITIYKDN
jgi:hypothetical protein